MLKELDNLLGQADTAAIALFEIHTATLKTALGPVSETLGQQISLFDFEAARKTLHTRLSP
ncbi:hypothetical protein GCM10027046_08040 [Uliginosibacterium flavum]|uniref:Uncharacterized protein n=1 Tax=Uliginosibacterium flavum TaxID=1396831 RepID=A0ABV2THX7_9RHOO